MFPKWVDWIGLIWYVAAVPFLFQVLRTSWRVHRTQRLAVAEALVVASLCYILLAVFYSFRLLARLEVAVDVGMLDLYFTSAARPLFLVAAFGMWWAICRDGTSK